MGFREVTVGVAIALFGCFSPKFQEGVSCGDDGLCPAAQVCAGGVCRSPDKIPDASDDASGCPNPTALMFSPSNFGICDLQVDPPLIELTASSTTLDTDAATLGGEAIGIILEQTGGPEIALFATREFTLAEGNFLNIVGSRPAVIVSLADMTIDGFIIATGNGPSHGSGGNSDGTCLEGLGADGIMEDDDTDGGGGGGGFAFAGGGGGGLLLSAAPGGAGGGTTGKAYNAAGGTENGSGLLAPLRGGCPGGVGGGNRGGVGGGAGGAIQLVAAGTITLSVEAVINVAGGGGRGGGTTNTVDLIDGAGGGGGGSGGGALLEAGLGIVVSAEGQEPFDAKAVITAAGGGGGGGACKENVGTVTAGNGGSMGPGAGGLAGVDVGSAGVGGAGGGDVEARLPGEVGGAGEMTCAGRYGGGGGGGSAGRIFLRSPSVTVDGVTFPPPDTTDL